MPRRTLVVFATFFISLLLYIDRTCIQVAGDGIKADLNLTDKQFGWILSIFTLGYALAQTPSGSIADRAGPRKLLTGVIALWSILTAATATGFNFARRAFPVRRIRSRSIPRYGPCHLVVVPHQ